MCRRRGPTGTATSLGTTNTGHPAPSAAAVPVTESSMARQTIRRQIQQRGRPQIGVGCGFALRHLVAAHRRRKILVANAVQRPLGERALGVGHQRHRSSFGGKRFQQVLRAVAPRQPAVEQVRCVVVQPADGLCHCDADRASGPGRYRPSEWCSPPSRPPSMRALPGSAGRRALRRAPPARYPRAFRSRRGCHPCRTAPLACQRFCHGCHVR